MSLIGKEISDFTISTDFMKNEGTSRFYVPECFPAVPDFDLTRAIIDTAKEMLSKLGCLNVEMESSALYTVCHRRKKRAAMISAVSGNLITGEVIYETVNEGLATGWDEERPD
ncbi:hypothetical protein [Enterocloster clostridioformis]|uniref:phosphorylase family protein n=1 Tax=Enterocloster clostridioformis TaxID=1531 RepID=UPI000420C423|nr:hypothetical protein [Enterocloster clostridioformis]